MRTPDFSDTLGRMMGPILHKHRLALKLRKTNPIFPSQFFNAMIFLILCRAFIEAIFKVILKGP